MIFKNIDFKNSSFIMNQNLLLHIMFYEFNFHG